MRGPIASSENVLDVPVKAFYVVAPCVKLYRSYFGAISDTVVQRVVSFLKYIREQAARV